MLDHIVTFYDNDMDQDELQCCKNSVDKEEHYRNQRLNLLEEAFNVPQNNPHE